MTWGSQFPLIARASNPFQWRDFILRAELNPFQDSPSQYFRTPPPRKPLSWHLPPNIWTPFKTPSQSAHAQFKVICSVCEILSDFAVNYWSFPNKRSSSAILYWTLPGVTCTQAWSHSYIFYRSLLLVDGSRTHMHYKSQVVTACPSTLPVLA